MYLRMKDFILSFILININLLVETQTDAIYQNFFWLNESGI